MKIIERIISVLLLTTFGFTNLNGQTDAAFGSVPVVNGKVVFNNSFQMLMGWMLRNNT